MRPVARGAIADPKPAGGVCSRRDFLGTTLLGLAFPRIVSERQTFEQVIRRLLPDLKLSEAVGQAWLHDQGRESSLEKEIAALKRRMSPLAQDGWNREKLVEAIARAIREDFSKEDGVCRLKGWALSVTECRLAAVRYLLLSPQLPSKGEAEREYREGAFLVVRGWGPRQTRLGTAFNSRQPGESVFWLESAGKIPETIKAYLGVEPLKTEIQGNRLSAFLPADAQARVVARPGVHPLVLVDPERRLWQKVGDFRILER